MNKDTFVGVTENPNTQIQIWERRVSDWKNTVANLARGTYEVVQIDWDRVGLKRIESPPIMGNGVTSFLSIERFNTLPKEGEKPKGIMKAMKDRISGLI